MFTSPLHCVPRFPRRTKISGGCGWGTSLVLQRMQHFSLNSVLAETPSIFRFERAPLCAATRANEQEAIAFTGPLATTIEPRLHGGDNEKARHAAGLCRETQARQYLTSRPCWLEKYAARSWTSRGERLATWPCMIGFLRLPFL